MQHLEVLFYAKHGLQADADDRAASGQRYRNSKILIKYCILLFHLTSEIPYHDLTITRKIQGHPLCAYILEISRVKELVLNTLEFTQKFFCIISHGYVI